MKPPILIVNAANSNQAMDIGGARVVESWKIGEVIATVEGRFTLNARSAVYKQYCAGAKTVILPIWLHNEQLC
ncbi:MAG: hypothetical protein WC980_00605 [Candidatus Brocadiia bacterium]